jgi:hypothetical protein
VARTTARLARSVRLRCIRRARLERSVHERRRELEVLKIHIMLYFSADIRVIPVANPGRRLRLAPGRDRAGNTYVSA